MTRDSRAEAARHYDTNPYFPRDLSFYEARIPAPDAHLLELGCGTGRTLVPLARRCGYVHGIDLSEAMLARCRERLHAEGVPSGRAQVERADISDFALGRTFDLIIAPYRVLQNLATDRQVTGLMRCIRRHLRPTGTCILNAFRPQASPEVLLRTWCTEGETFQWETRQGNSRTTCHDRRTRIDPAPLVLYPELIYRRYEGDQLSDEAVLSIAMRCYYPDDLADLIVAHGFRTVARWGGYAGEPYGEGPELVIQFTPASLHLGETRRDRRRVSGT